MAEPTIEDRLATVESKLATLTDQSKSITRLEAKLHEMIGVLNEAHDVSRKIDSNVRPRRVEKMS